jgi:hypothetical protein
LPTPGISIGSPRTSPPARRTLSLAAAMSSTEMTTDGCCAGQSGFLAKKPPLIAPGVVEPRASLGAVVASTYSPMSAPSASVCQPNADA